jgi:hypothetical protein
MCALWAVGLASGFVSGYRHPIIGCPRKPVVGKVASNKQFGEL